MPKDIKQNELKAGDKIMIPAVVTAITHSSEEYRNIAVETEHPMRPGLVKNKWEVNSSQVQRVEG